MNDSHIGENAELYAVGSLDELERQRVEAHVANCADCLRRLGQAEETVLGLERETQAAPLPADARAPQFIAPRRAVWWLGALAAAAALIIGYLLPHPPTASNGPAQVAMLHSHFNHAQFTGAGPLAKVIYARDRSWYYVIVEGSHAYSVEGVGTSGTIDLGSVTTRDGTSELFVPHARRFERIELRDGPNVVETAQIR
ncbi:MAG: zf-HC2 domain-containing protein [Candidatus Eremiobacteraeota bacterium]|nr:zf-HC2 domain-containing protein [Candidatus Eremiobacteraeota bacterium]